MSVIAQAGAKGRQLHKFGGSSLADVKCYLRVAGIMAEYSQPDDMMVVSAAGSTTNQLINWLKLSQTDRLSAHQVQQTLRRYQCDLISGLLPAEEADNLISAFVSDLEHLAALLDSGINDAVYAEVVGHGEVWSARLMSAVLNQQGLPAAWLDAREFLRAERAAQHSTVQSGLYPVRQHSCHHCCHRAGLCEEQILKAVQPSGDFDSVSAVHRHRQLHRLRVFKSHERFCEQFSSAVAGHRPYQMVQRTQILAGDLNHRLSVDVVWVQFYFVLFHDHRYRQIPI